MLADRDFDLLNGQVEIGGKLQNAKRCTESAGVILNKSAVTVGVTAAGVTHDAHDAVAGMIQWQKA